MHDLLIFRIVHVVQEYFQHPNYDTWSTVLADIALLKLKTKVGSLKLSTYRNKNVREAIQHIMCLKYLLPW